MPESDPTIRPAAPAATLRGETGVALLLVAMAFAVWFSAPSAGRPVDAAAARLRLNPNHASADELMLLPGIGPQLAARIVAFRQESSAPPAFRTLEDLHAVSRIGPGLTAELAEWLVFE